MTRFLLVPALLIAAAVNAAAAGSTASHDSSATPALLTPPPISLSGSNPAATGLSLPPATPANAVAPASPTEQFSSMSQQQTPQQIKMPGSIDNFRVDSILASVNGQPVSLLDVVDECGKEEARISMLYNGETARESIRNLRKKTLEEIVNRKLIVEEYQRDPFEIPRQNIENFIDEMSLNVSDGTRKSLKKKIEDSGITLDDLEERARDRLIVDFMLGNLFFKGVAITPQETFDYYQKNCATFAESPRTRLEVLFLPENRENLNTLVKDIQNDLKSQNEKIFKSLVSLHSAAPNAKNGGDLGWIELDKLRPEFVRATDKQPVGFITGPVNTSEGIYFLRIKEIDKGGVKPFNEVHKDITEKLRHDQREKVYKEYINKLRAQAMIRYYID